jgi:hypothetical protein
MFILCEPISRGYEHAVVNAGFIVLLLQAYPQDKCLFVAEAAHQTEVLALARKYAPEVLSRVQTRTLPLFESQEGRLRDVRLALRYVAALRTWSRGVSNVRWLLCSTPLTLAVVLSLCTRRRYYFVVHSILEKLDGVSRPKRLWRFFFDVRRVLPFTVRHSGIPIVLAEYIKDAVVQAIPRVRSAIRVIDHPFFSLPQKKEKTIPGLESIILTLPGVATLKKNSHLFFELAQRLAALSIPMHPTFRLVGKITDSRVKQYVNNCVTIIGAETGLTKSEYDRLLDESDFIVLLYPSNTYRYTASGVFFDVLRSNKPIIGLNNPAFAYYRRRFGELGYIYDSFEELCTQMIQKLQDPQTLHKEYAVFQQNLQKACEELSITQQLAAVRNVFAD